MTTKSDQTIIDYCGARGLIVEAVERDGAVLILHPATDAPLPGAERLRDIAHGIESGDARYVTLGLDAYRGDDHREASDG